MPSPRVYNFFICSCPCSCFRSCPCSIVWLCVSVVYSPLIPSNLHDNTYGPLYFFFHNSKLVVSGFILFIEPI